MKVKICGIKLAEDAQMCESLGADALVFVHFPGRGRSVPLESIAAITSTLDSSVMKVLVCAPKSSSEAIQMVHKANADTVQLYSLLPEDLNEIREQGIGVIRKVPPVRNEALKFAEAADALLFEEEAPGTGHSYDYSRIPVDCCPRAIIAGGLTLNNLHLAKAMKPYGLDVSSGVERALGRKDRTLVSEFIRRCKS
jgi:phosphoribosylanthranilate isomerase